MAGTVTVACKHPHGLHLDVTDTSGAPRRVTLKGCAVPYGSIPRLTGGYALTEVDADHWSAWVEKHKTSSLLTDRIVFAHEKRADAQAKAREQEGVKQIAPPLDPGATVIDGQTVEPSKVSE